MKDLTEIADPFKKTVNHCGYPENELYTSVDALTLVGEIAFQDSAQKSRNYSQLGRSYP